MLQLITVSSMIVHLPQCYRPEHKPQMCEDGLPQLLWVLPSAENTSQMHPGLKINGRFCRRAGKPLP